MKHVQNKSKKPSNNRKIEILAIILILVVVSIGLIFNQFFSLKIKTKKSPVLIFLAEKNIIPGLKTKKNNDLPAIDPEDLKVDLSSLSEGEQASVAAFLKLKRIKNTLIPTGTPEIYGDELGISFEKVQEAINDVKIYDLTYGNNVIELSNNEMKRYINIGSMTACEYCCTAKTLVHESGDAACGCEHSQMMRGLSAYLLQNHPQMSDEEILNEVNAWKRTFFPQQILTAKIDELKKSGDKGMDLILREFPDFLPQMVGSC